MILFYLKYFSSCLYDIAPEQKARVTYENLILLTDDPLVKDTLKFLREREIVHFQRFGEGLRLAEEVDQRKRYF
ncbi:manganese catalase family protein [Sedimentibacter sp. zth1]|nr:manganese catalase family protein [Sedimentibacter sp. zth1]